MKEIELYVNHLLKWNENVTLINKLEPHCFYVINPRFKLSMVDLKQVNERYKAKYKD